MSGVFSPKGEELPVNIFISATNEVRSAQIAWNACATEYESTIAEKDKELRTKDHDLKFMKSELDSVTDELIKRDEAIAEKDARIKEIEKINGSLTRSLKHLHDQVSNGEHLDSEWVRNVILEEPHSFILDSLVRKNESLKSELQAERAKNKA